MKIALVSDLARWRSDAVAKVDRHFNELALRTLHSDLCEMARIGISQSILKRDTQRRELIMRIDAATTPAQINEIISTL